MREFIIEKIVLKSSSICRPKNGKYNAKDDTSKLICGTPGGGYWISCGDLRKFGEFIYEQYLDGEFMRYVKKYGKEYYENNKIRHSGSIDSSSCDFIVYLDKKIAIVVASDYYRDAIDLTMIFYIYK